MTSGELCCAFFVAQEFYLMDYLMTMPAQLQQRLGSCFLQKLLDDPFAQRSIVGEVNTGRRCEDELRRRRLAFYERNRFLPDGVRAAGCMEWITALLPGTCQPARTTRPSRPS